MELPKQVAANFLTPFEAADGCTVSPTTAKAVLVSLISVLINNQPVGVLQQKDANNEIVRVFVTEDVNITCTDATRNANFKQGWNLVSFDKNQVGNIVANTSLPWAFTGNLPNDNNTKPTLTEITLVSPASGTVTQGSGVTQGTANFALRDAEDSLAKLIITARTDKPSIISDLKPECTDNGGISCSLGFSINAVAVGTATITVKVEDSAGAFAEQSVTVTVVEAANTSPVLSDISLDKQPIIQNLQVADVTANATFKLSDTEQAANTLTLLATSDNQNFVADGSLKPSCDANGDCSLALTVSPKQVATATITVKATDNANATAEKTFTVHVSPRLVNSLADTGAHTLRQVIADAVDGDVIAFNTEDVFSGTSAKTITLQSTIELTKDLRIQGTGLSKLILSGNNTTRILDVTESDAEVVLSNMTLTNGKCEGCWGGAVSGLGTLTIKNSAITNSNALRGGAIHFINGTLTLENTQVTGNTAQEWGGAIFNNEATLLIKARSIIANNTSNQVGGGILNTANATTTIEASSVKDNTAQNQGGGVQNAGGTVIIKTGTTISGNAAPIGGGILNFASTASLTIDDSNINNNSSNNDADNTGGGGILNAQGATATIRNGSEIAGNSTTKHGGGIYNWDSTLTIVDSEVVNNSAVKSGGGIYNFGAKASLTISGEKSAIGKTDSNNDPNNLNNNGGSNKAANGGGIYNNGGTVTMTGGRVDNNFASNDGGGIVNLAGTFEMKDNTIIISFNKAKNGGGIVNTATLKGPVFVARNLATNVGGGIASAEGGNARVSGAIRLNKAVNGGGIFIGGGVVNSAAADVSDNLPNNIAP